MSRSPLLRAFAAPFAMLLVSASPSAAMQDAAKPVVFVQQATTSLQEAEAPRTIGIFVGRMIDGQYVTTGELRVGFSMSGTATPGVDHRVSPEGTLLFPDGRGQVFYYITVLPDDEPEETETIILTLEDGAFYTVDPARRELRVDLLDDDTTADPPPAPAPAPAPPAPPPPPPPASGLLLTELSPDSASAGRAVFITVRGAGFVRGSRVRWGSELLPTTFVSQNELRARLTLPVLRNAGGDRVTVRIENPGTDGGASNPLPFRIVP